MLRFSLPHTTHSSRVASCPYKPAYHSVVSSLSLVNIIPFIWTPGLGTRNIRLRLPNHHDIWSNYPCTHNHPHHPIFSTWLTHLMEHVFQRKERRINQLSTRLCQRNKKGPLSQDQTQNRTPQGLWRKFRCRSKLVSKNEKWADAAIKVFIHFQTELKKWREDNKDKPNEEQIQQFTNRPSFGSWKEMAGCMADFFITNESISNAIKNLKRLKQGNWMVEDYWMDFCAWKDLT